MTRPTGKREFFIPSYQDVKIKESPVFNCPCGNRYIVTREGQSECLTCYYAPIKKADHRKYYE